MGVFAPKRRNYDRLGTDYGDYSDERIDQCAVLFGHGNFACFAFPYFEWTEQPHPRNFAKRDSGFPDLNPEWVLMGTGDMYKKGVAEEAVPTLPLDEAAEPTPERPGSPISPPGSSAAAPTGASSGASYRHPLRPEAGNSSSAAVHSSSAGAYPSSAGAYASSQPAVAAPSRPLEAVVPEAAVADVVRETMQQYLRPQRQIVEVRIFFDDGTYESFGAPR